MRSHGVIQAESLEEEMFQLDFEDKVRISGGRVFQVGRLVGAKGERQEDEKRETSSHAWRMERVQYHRSDDIDHKGPGMSEGGVGQRVYP